MTERWLAIRQSLQMHVLDRQFFYVQTIFFKVRLIQTCKIIFMPNGHLMTLVILLPVRRAMGKVPKVLRFQVIQTIKSRQTELKYCNKY
jgi:hypothetical protein